MARYLTSTTILGCTATGLTQRSTKQLMWALEWLLLVSYLSNPISVFDFYVFHDSGFAAYTALHSIMCYCEHWIKMEPL